jgi:two-component system response regulator DevR
MIRVFIVDDHEIVRRGLSELFEAEEDIEVVGEAGTVADSLIRIPLANADVAILDYRLPDGDGIEVCRSLHDSPGGPRCIMLTSFSDDEALAAAVIAGAEGYLIKEIRGSDLVASSARWLAAGRSSIRRRRHRFSNGCDPGRSRMSASPRSRPRNVTCWT